jgi:hypothetical protein
VNKIYTVFRHGKHIKVRDLELPTSRRTRRTTGELFAKVNLREAADVAKILGSPGVLIMPLLVHLAWQAKSATFPLSNELLTRYGINRWAKYRTLNRLEKAGKISLQTGPGKAVIVTMLTSTINEPPT